MIGLESLGATVVFSLLASAAWGAADFSGGLATRRAQVFGVVVSTQGLGLVLLVVLALLWREPMPPVADLLTGAAAGLTGVVGLAALYMALAAGQMGLAAPLIAVLAGVIPVVYGIFQEGWPDAFQIAGFGIALAGVWLISRSGGASGGWLGGLGLALIAGIGFGGFFILIDSVRSDAVFWPLVAARMASTPLMAGIALLRRQSLLSVRAILPVILAAGVLDALGNTFFVLATDAGRLDIATVLSSLYPVSTVILARVVLKEQLTRSQTVGVLLSILAIVLIAL